MNSPLQAAQLTTGRDCGGSFDHSSVPWKSHPFSLVPGRDSFGRNFVVPIANSYGWIVAETRGYSSGEAVSHAEAILAAINERAEMIKTIELLLAGAKVCQARGVVQPQLNGGVVMAEAILNRIEERKAA